MPGVSVRVPEGLRDLMKSFAKEVLRQRPLDIYKFSSQYFESMLQEEQDFDFQGYEVISPYETIFKNGARREQNQIPLALVCAIIPEELTELIKDFIKAVLRANPNNICKFAVVYFQSLREQRHKTCSVQYKSYENYLQNTQCVKFPSYVRCTCGRVIGEGMAGATTTNGQSVEYQIKDTVTEANSPQTKNDSGSKGANLTKSSFNDEKYINAVYILQRFFRRSLGRQRTNAQSYTSTKNTKDFQMTAETAAYVIQRTLRKFIVPAAEKSGARHAASSLHMENVNQSEVTSDTVFSPALMLADATVKMAETEGRGSRNEPISKKYDFNNAPYLNSDKNQSAVTTNKTESKGWRGTRENSSNGTLPETESKYQTLSSPVSNNTRQAESSPGTIQNTDKGTSDREARSQTHSGDISKKPTVAEDKTSEKSSSIESTATHPGSDSKTISHSASTQNPAEDANIIDQSPTSHLELEVSKPSVNKAQLQEGTDFDESKSLQDLSGPAARHFVPGDKTEYAPGSNSSRGTKQNTHNGKSETSEGYKNLSEDITKNPTIVDERNFLLESTVTSPGSDNKTVGHSESNQNTDQVSAEDANIIDHNPTSRIELNVSAPSVNKARLKDNTDFDETKSLENLSGAALSHIVPDDEIESAAAVNIQTQVESSLGRKQNNLNGISETEVGYQKRFEDIPRKSPVAEDITSKRPSLIESTVTSPESDNKTFSHSESAQSTDQVSVEEANIIYESPTPHLGLDVSAPSVNTVQLYEGTDFDQKKSIESLSGSAASHIVPDDEIQSFSISNIETQAKSLRGTHPITNNGTSSETELEYAKVSDDSQNVRGKRAVVESITTERPALIESTANSPESDFINVGHSKSSKRTDHVLVENARSLHQHLGTDNGISSGAESKYQTHFEDIPRKRSVAEYISSERPSLLESTVKSPESDNKAVRHSESTKNTAEAAYTIDQSPTSHLESGVFAPSVITVRLQEGTDLNETKSLQDLSGPAASHFVPDNKNKSTPSSNIETQVESSLGKNQNTLNGISVKEAGYKKRSEDIATKSIVAEGITSKRPSSLESTVTSPGSDDKTASHSEFTQSTDQVFVKEANIIDQSYTPHLEVDVLAPSAKTVRLQEGTDLDETNSLQGVSGPAASHFVADDKIEPASSSNIQTKVKSSLGRKQNTLNGISETELGYQKLFDDISRKSPVAEDITSKRPSSIESTFTSPGSDDKTSSHSEFTQSTDQVSVEEANIKDQSLTPHLEVDVLAPSAKTVRLQEGTDLDETNSLQGVSGPAASHFVADDKIEPASVSNIETQVESSLGKKQTTLNGISETESGYIKLSKDISRKSTVVEVIPPKGPSSIKSTVKSPESNNKTVDHSESAQSTDQVSVEDVSHLELGVSAPSAKTVRLQEGTDLNETKSIQDLSGPAASHFVPDDKIEPAPVSNIETQAESSLGRKQNTLNVIYEIEAGYEELSEDISRKSTEAEDINSKGPSSFESTVTSPGSDDKTASHSEFTQSTEQVSVEDGNIIDVVGHSESTQSTAENVNMVDQSPTSHLESGVFAPSVITVRLQEGTDLNETKSLQDLSGPAPSHFVPDDKNKSAPSSNIETQAESSFGKNQNTLNGISATEAGYKKRSEDITTKSIVAEGISESERPSSIESTITSPESDKTVGHSEFTQSTDQVSVEDGNIIDAMSHSESTQSTAENVNIVAQSPASHLEMNVFAPSVNKVRLQESTDVNKTKSLQDLSGPAASHFVADNKIEAAPSSNIQTQVESSLGRKQTTLNGISETEVGYQKRFEDIPRKSPVAEDITSKRPSLIESTVTSPESDNKTFSHSESAQSTDQVSVEEANIIYESPTPHLGLDVSAPSVNTVQLYEGTDFDQKKSIESLSGSAASHIVPDDEIQSFSISNIETQAKSLRGTHPITNNGTSSETELEYAKVSDDSQNVRGKRAVVESITTERPALIESTANSPESDFINVGHSKSSKRTDHVLVENARSLHQHLGTDNGISSGAESKYQTHFEDIPRKRSVAEYISSERPSLLESTVKSPESDNKAVRHSESTKNTAEAAYTIDQSPTSHLESGVFAPSVITVRLQEGTDLNETKSIQDLSGPAASHFVPDDKIEPAPVSNIETQAESSLGRKQNTLNVIYEIEAGYEELSEDISRKSTEAEDINSKGPSSFESTVTSPGSDDKTASHSEFTQSTEQVSVEDGNIIDVVGHSESTQSTAENVNMVDQSPTSHLESGVFAPSVITVRLQEGTDLNETKSLQDLSGPAPSHFVPDDKNKSAPSSNIETQAESSFGKNQNTLNGISATEAGYKKRSEDITTKSIVAEGISESERPSSIESTITSPESDKTVGHSEFTQSTDQVSVEDGNIIDAMSHSESTQSTAENVNIVAQSPASHLEMNVFAPSVNKVRLQESTDVNKTKSLQDLSGPAASHFVADNKIEAAPSSNIQTQVESSLGRKQTTLNGISETEVGYQKLFEDISRKSPVAEDITSKRPSSIESTVTSPGSDDKTSSHSEFTQSTDQVSVEEANIKDQSHTPHLEVDVLAPSAKTVRLHEGTDLDETNSLQGVSGPAASHFVADDKIEPASVSNIETQVESSLGRKQNTLNVIYEIEAGYQELSEDISRKSTEAEDITSKGPSSLESTVTSPGSDDKTASHSEFTQSTEQISVEDGNIIDVVGHSKSTQSTAENVNIVDQSPTSHLELGELAASAKTVRLQEGTDLNETKSLQDLSGPATSHAVHDDKNDKKKTFSHTESTQNTAEDTYIIDQSPTSHLESGVFAPSVNTVRLKGSADLNETKSLHDLSEPAASHFVPDDKHESATVLNIETQVESSLGKKQTTLNGISETESGYIKLSKDMSRKSTVVEVIPPKRPSLIDSTVTSPESDNKTVVHSEFAQSTDQVSAEDANIIDQSRTPHLESGILAASINTVRLQESTDMNEAKSLKCLSGPAASHFVPDHKNESDPVSNIETQAESLSETHIALSGDISRKPTVVEDFTYGSPSKVMGESKVTSLEIGNKTASHSGSTQSADQVSVENGRRLDQNPTSLSKHGETAPSVNKVQISESIDSVSGPATINNKSRSLVITENIHSEEIIYLPNETNRNESIKPLAIANETGEIEDKEFVIPSFQANMAAQDSNAFAGDINTSVSSTHKATNFEQLAPKVLAADVIQLQNKTIEEGGLINSQRCLGSNNKDESENNLADDKTDQDATPVIEGSTERKAFSNTDDKLNDKAKTPHIKRTTHNPLAAESSTVKVIHSTSSKEPGGSTETDAIKKVSAPTCIATTEPNSASGNALINRSIGLQNSHQNHSGTNNSNKVDHSLSKHVKQPKQPSREYCIGIPLEARIAELHLKSFKTSDTSPPWYASIVEDSSARHNETEPRPVAKPKVTVSDQTITKSDQLINYESNEVSPSNSLSEIGFERGSRELNKDPVDGATEESSDTPPASTECPKNERMPTYLYGIHTPRQTPTQSRKVYKKPTAFTVPFGTTNTSETEPEKYEAKSNAEVQSSKNEPELVHTSSIKNTSQNILTPGVSVHLEPNQVQMQLDLEYPTTLSDKIGEPDLRHSEDEEIGLLTYSKATNIQDEPCDMSENQSRNRAIDVEHRADINVANETTEPMLDTIVELNEGSNNIESTESAELDSESDSSWSMPKELDENISAEYVNKNDVSAEDGKSPRSLNETERHIKGGIYEFDRNYTSQITADGNNDTDINSIPEQAQKSVDQMNVSNRKQTRKTYLSTPPDAQAEEAAASIIQRAFRKYIASGTNRDELKTPTNSSWNSSQTTQIFVENDLEKSSEDSQALSNAEIDNDELNDNKSPPLDNTSTYQISSLASRTLRNAEQDQEKEQEEKVEDKKIDWFVGTELIQTSKVVDRNDKIELLPTSDLPLEEFKDSVESKHDNDLHATGVGPSAPFPTNHPEINTFDKNIHPEIFLEQSATQSAIDDTYLEASDEYREAFVPHILQASQPENEELGSVKKKSHSTANEGGVPVANIEAVLNSDTFTNRTNTVEIISSFLVSERAHTENSSKPLEQKPVTSEISITKDFVNSQIHFCESDVPYEKLEEHCVKRRFSLTYLVDEEVDDDDTSDKVGDKLRESDETLKNAQGLENNAVISPDLEDDKVIVNRLQREDTREDSAQSDCVVFGGSYEKQTPEQPEKANVEMKIFLKSVTYEETIEYIEPPELVSSASLCLDDDTSENIRKQMMAYSLSEADSDAAEANMSEMEANNAVANLLDSNISSALADMTGTSTETESTIVSAANISRAGTGGNEAINASLENLIETEAVSKIQKAYRKYYQQKKQRPKIQADLQSSEQAMNLESSLAARRMTLQRGNALRNDSAPDEENLAGSNSKGRTKLHANEQKLDSPSTGENKPIKVVAAGNATKSAADVTSYHPKKIFDNKLKWLAMRQNSMPVQIESEVFRVIPKHMRKRIKSAEGGEKGRRRILKD